MAGRGRRGSGDGVITVRAGRGVNVRYLANLSKNEKRQNDTDGIVPRAEFHCLISLASPYLAVVILDICFTAPDGGCVSAVRASLGGDNPDWAGQGFYVGQRAGLTALRAERTATGDHERSRIVSIFPNRHVLPKSLLRPPGTAKARCQCPARKPSLRCIDFITGVRPATGVIC